MRGLSAYRLVGTIIVGTLSPKFRREKSKRKAEEGRRLESFYNECTIRKSVVIEDPPGELQ